MEQHPVSHSYMSQRLRLHYVEWPNPEAEPLLMVHGGSDHCRNWDWVAKALNPHFNIIAPDLRGHGESQWLNGGNYREMDFVYDIAQLIELRGYESVNIVAHSFGGFTSLLYAGLNPERVKKMVVIEGMGLSPKALAERLSKPRHERINARFKKIRELSSRQHKRYESLDQALLRMKKENPHLSDKQARHLTKHAARQNEDGSYSWKFDNYLRADTAEDLPYTEMHDIWQRITCPILLFRGEDSWASDPVVDGRIKHLQNARLVNVANAGHWLHHDQLEVFLGEAKPFLLG